MASAATLKKATVRLYADDIRFLQSLAREKRSKWQIELRQLVHKALKGQKLVGELIR